MRFNMESKHFVNALNSVTLKGKYPSGASYQFKSLSDYVYIVSTDTSLSFFNADNTTSCSYRVSTAGDVIDVFQAGECILDIPKTIKYLKTFSGNVSVKIKDYVTLTTENKTVTMPYVVSHPCYAMIEHIRYLKIPTDGTMPIFGKEDTSFEARVTINSENLLDAAKSCDVIGMGHYKFDYNGTSFLMSSPQDGIERIEINVELLTHDGDEATVELAGPFAQFLIGPTMIFLKDEFPILFISPDRKLLKAPRITGR